MLHSTMNRIPVYTRPPGSWHSFTWPRCALWRSSTITPFFTLIRIFSLSLKNPFLLGFFFFYILLSDDILHIIYQMNILCVCLFFLIKIVIFCFRGVFLVLFFYFLGGFFFNIFFLLFFALFVLTKGVYSVNTLGLWGSDKNYFDPFLQELGRAVGCIYIVWSTKQDVHVIYWVPSNLQRNVTQYSYLVKSKLFLLKHLSLDKFGQ